MTFEEIKQQTPGKRIVGMASRDNGLQLFAGTQPIPWPDDWPPEGITGQWIEDQGVEIIQVKA